MSIDNLVITHIGIRGTNIRTTPPINRLARFLDSCQAFDWSCFGRRRRGSFVRSLLHLGFCRLSRQDLLGGGHHCKSSRCATILVCGLGSTFYTKQRGRCPLQKPWASQQAVQPERMHIHMRTHWMPYTSVGPILQPAFTYHKTLMVLMGPPSCPYTTLIVYLNVMDQVACSCDSMCARSFSMAWWHCRDTHHVIPTHGSGCWKDLKTPNSKGTWLHGHSTNQPHHERVPPVGPVAWPPLP